MMCVAVRALPRREETRSSIRAMNESCFEPPEWGRLALDAPFGSCFNSLIHKLFAQQIDCVLAASDV